MKTSGKYGEQYLENIRAKLLTGADRRIKFISFKHNLVRIKTAAESLLFLYNPVLLYQNGFLKETHARIHDRPEVAAVNPSYGFSHGPVDTFIFSADNCPDFSWEIERSVESRLGRMEVSSRMVFATKEQLGYNISTNFECHIDQPPEGRLLVISVAHFRMANGDEPELNRVCNTLQDTCHWTPAGAALAVDFQHLGVIRRGVSPRSDTVKSMEEV